LRRVFYMPSGETAEEAREDDEIKDDEFEAEAEPEKSAKPKKLDLERLVAQPTWKEMLFDLVVREHLDPWNIDIGVIAGKYLERIRNMQTLDLHIPANIILAASILLRFKSDAIRLEEEVQEVEQETFIGEDQPPVEIPMLTLRTRIPPKRKVTLDELVQALEEVFEDQKRREELKNKPVIPEKMIVTLPEFDIERQTEEVYKRIKATADSQGLATLSSILKDDSAQEKVFTLLPLLFLAQAGKINIFQEKFFGEIFVQLLV